MYALRMHKTANEKGTPITGRLSRGAAPPHDVRLPMIGSRILAILGGVRRRKMDFLWQALGICVIVCVVLYSLASRWAKTLRQHAWALRRLADRIELLEIQSTAPPKRDDAAPLPLSQVFTFSFILTDNFWLQTLHLERAEWNAIRSKSSFLGSVKLERWRSHTVATVTEVLPASETSKWQTRSFDFFPDARQTGHSLTLWQIALKRPDGSPQSPPCL